MLTYLIMQVLLAPAEDGRARSATSKSPPFAAALRGIYWSVSGGIAFGGVPGETTAMAWLPADFTHPNWVPVDDGYHLRPITAADADLDYPAVMGSQPRLWSIFGQAWGWPPVSMTYQQDVEDLARHEAEIAAHQSFNYALFDDAETALLGCVYLDSPAKQGADAEISWWAVMQAPVLSAPWTRCCPGGSPLPGPWQGEDL